MPLSEQLSGIALSFGAPEHTSNYKGHFANRS